MPVKQMKITDIKLIASDLDGTLLDPESRLAEDFFPLFEQLYRHGIPFAAASGRQYYNLLKIFAPVKDRLIFIAENGAYVVHENRELLVVDMDIHEIRRLIATLRRIPGIYPILCGKKQAYVENDHPVFLEQAHTYYERCINVNDLLQISDDQFLKIAVCDLNGAAGHSYPELRPLEAKYQVTLSGKIWIDISDKKANKGYALRQLQHRLAVTPQQTMVFGDYMNDLPMMEQARYSYAMENAVEEVKKAARFRAPDNAHNGVIRILEKLTTELPDTP